MKRRIIGNPVGVPNPQTDWLQRDGIKSDFLKNKPTTLEEYGIKEEVLGCVDDVKPYVVELWCDFSLFPNEGYYTVEDVDSRFSLESLSNAVTTRSSSRKGAYVLIYGPLNKFYFEVPFTEYHINSDGYSSYTFSKTTILQADDVDKLMEVIVVYDSQTEGWTVNLTSFFYTKGEMYNKVETDKLFTNINAELQKKADKATTLSGYGIEDAYTKPEVDDKIALVVNLTADDEGNIVSDIPDEKVISALDSGRNVIVSGNLGENYIRTSQVAKMIDLDGNFAWCFNALNSTFVVETVHFKPYSGDDYSWQIGNSVELRTNYNTYTDKETDELLDKIKSKIDQKTEEIENKFSVIDEELKALGEYELIEKIVVGYSITTAKPDDWDTNYTSYYKNTGTLREPVYTALTEFEEWEIGKYYSFTENDLTTLYITKEPDGRNISFSKVYIYWEDASAYGKNINGTFIVTTTSTHPGFTKEKVNINGNGTFITNLDGTNIQRHVITAEINNGLLKIRNYYGDYGKQSDYSANTPLQNDEKITGFCIRRANNGFLIPNTEIYIYGVRA